VLRYQPGDVASMPGAIKGGFAVGATLDQTEIKAEVVGGRAMSTERKSFRSMKSSTYRLPHHSPPRKAIGTAESQSQCLSSQFVSVKVMTTIRES
jgi:hypothetical protein